MAEERSAASNYVVYLGTNRIETVGAHPWYSNQWEKHYSISRLAEVIINFFWKPKLEIHNANYLQRSPIIPLYFMMSQTMKNMAIPK